MVQSILQILFFTWLCVCIYVCMYVCLCVCLCVCILTNSGSADLGPVYMEKNCPGAPKLGFTR